MYRNLFKMELLADDVKTKRQQEGLTVKEFAELSSCSEELIEEIENQSRDEFSVTINGVTNVSNYLGESVAYYTK